MRWYSFFPLTILRYTYSLHFMDSLTFQKATILVKGGARIHIQAVWLQQSHWNGKPLSINSAQVERHSRTWTLENQSNILTSQRMDTEPLLFREEQCWRKPRTKQMASFMSSPPQPPAGGSMWQCYLTFWGWLLCHISPKLWEIFSFHLFHICLRKSGMTESLSTSTEGTKTFHHLDISEENGKTVLIINRQLKMRINQSERHPPLIYFLVKLEIWREKPVVGSKHWP